MRVIWYLSEWVTKIAALSEYRTTVIFPSWEIGSIENGERLSRPTEINNNRVLSGIEKQSNELSTNIRVLFHHDDYISIKFRREPTE